MTDHVTDEWNMYIHVFVIAITIIIIIRLLLLRLTIYHIPMQILFRRRMQIQFHDTKHWICSRFVRLRYVHLCRSYRFTVNRIHEDALCPIQIESIQLINKLKGNEKCTYIASKSIVSYVCLGNLNFSLMHIVTIDRRQRWTEQIGSALKWAAFIIYARIHAY